MGKYKIRNKRAYSISWGHWFALVNIFLALSIGLIYTISVPTTGNLLARFYLFISWLGHFSFLTFLVFIIAIFPFCILLPYSRFLRGIGTFIFSLGLFALLMDALFFHFYQFHLNAYALTKLSEDAERWFDGASFVFLFIALIVYLCIFAIQLLISNLTWKKLPYLRSIRFFKTLPILFFSAFISSHFVHIWADASLFQPITQQDDTFPLSYPSTAKSLMARHGWLSTKNVSAESSVFTELNTSKLRYPTSPLLCARTQPSPPTFVYAFEHLSERQVQQIQTQLPQVVRFNGDFIVSQATRSNTFEFVYGISKKYEVIFEQQHISPVFIEALNNLGHTVSWFHDTNLVDTTFIQFNFLNQHLLKKNASPHKQASIQVTFAANSEIESHMSHIQMQLKQNPGIKIVILSLSPTQNQTPTHALYFPEITAPLLTLNIPIHSHRALILLEDLMPNLVSQYIECANNNLSFSNAIPLNSAKTGYPRLFINGQSFILFENELKSVFDTHGNAFSFDQNGLPLENKQPYMPFFIDGLSELQRFSAPPRKLFN